MISLSFIALEYSPGIDAEFYLQKSICSKYAIETAKKKRNMFKSNNEETRMTS